MSAIASKLIPSKHQAAAARIVAMLENLAGCDLAAARILNDITNELLRLDNTELAAFGNMLGQEEMTRLLTLHYAQGTGRNALAAPVVEEITLASGAPRAAPKVDVSSFDDKLARQSRRIEFDGQTFSIVEITP